MNTLAFNILFFIFTVLFVLTIVTWIRAKNTKAYMKANNPDGRKLVMAIVVGVSLLIAVVIWFLIPSIRFRAIVSIPVLATIILFLYKTRKMVFRIRMLGLLTFCVYVPMLILYLD